MNIVNQMLRDHSNRPICDSQTFVVFTTIIDNEALKVRNVLQQDCHLPKFFCVKAPEHEYIFSKYS